jgi:alkylation response protein AidB-like acyl-CoA dehydrogenase
MPTLTPEPVAPPKNHTRPATARDEPRDWAQIAAGLASEFRQTFVERERTNARPLAEIQRFRDTGLVNLLIPTKFGGEGGSLGDAARAILEISKADGSLGFLLSFHYSNSNLPRQLDLETDGEIFDRKSAAHQWFWGNVIGPFHISAEPKPDGGFVVFGTKHMCTGATLGDAVRITGKRTDRDEMINFAIPISRPGIKSHDDWDHLGLLSTETHTVTLDRVEVHPDEVIRSSNGVGGAGFAPFAGGSLFSSAFYIGSLTGALESVRDYMRQTPSNPRPMGGNFEFPVEDPFNQLVYGEAWIKLQALEALFSQQIREAEEAWDHRRTLDPKVLADIGRRGTALQIFASQVVLDFTAKLFELTGGRSLARTIGFDRYWRDVRSYSVHHPTSYMIKGIGEWALAGKPAQRPSVFDVRRRYEARKAITNGATKGSASN